MFEHIRETAITVVLEAFETMFFIPLEVRRDSRDLSYPVLRSEIGFNGKYSGKIRLYLSPELATIMAINFMGITDGNASEPEIMDAVNEVCNIICGNLISLLDQKTPHVLTLPQTRSISSLEQNDGTEPSSLRIDFDTEEGQSVRLEIQFENEITGV